MYKVLLVDDERIILEGISTMLPWQQLNIELIGLAKNGLEGLQLIEQYEPDIVISDIKMPALDGIQLIERVKVNYPKIKFILLSGFNEFEYAQRAMQFGVKHYLLKPCNEEHIIHALHEVIEELSGDRKRDQFMEQLQLELKKALPHAKEQFLKELVTNKTYGQHDWQVFSRLFQLDDSLSKIQLILCEIDSEVEYEHLFAVKNISEDVLGKHLVMLSTTIGRQVLLLIRDDEHPDQIFNKLSTIKETFQQYYKRELSIAASRVDSIQRVRQLYHNTKMYLSYRFYVGESTIITKNDIVNDEAKSQSFYYDEERFMLYIRAGNLLLAEQEIKKYFHDLVECRFDSAISKSYVISMLVSISRLVNKEQPFDLVQHLRNIESMTTLPAMESYLLQLTKDITLSHLQLHQRKHSTIIEKVIDIVNFNIHSAQLSLNWVASDVLYMNPDYLGKLFKKEIGDKFSNYVMKLRIEKAMEIIDSSQDFKIFELAEQLGFGDNPQYFSQVFKKQTGFTPTEYRNRSL